MTAREASEKSGLSLDRIYQFCRYREILPQEISDEQYAILMARRNRKVKNDSNPS